MRVPETPPRGTPAAVKPSGGVLVSAEQKWLDSAARSLSSRAGSTSVVAWAIRSKKKPSIFIDAQRAAGGWIVAI